MALLLNGPLSLANCTFFVFFSITLGTSTGETDATAAVFFFFAGLVMAESLSSDDDDELLSAKRFLFVIKRLDGEVAIAGLELFLGVHGGVRGKDATDESESSSDALLLLLGELLALAGLELFLDTCGAGVRGEEATDESESSSEVLQLLLLGVLLDETGLELFLGECSGVQGEDESESS